MKLNMGDSTNKGAKGYWRRRGYKRLGSATAATDEPRSNRQKWSWRIRMPRRLKIKLRFKFNPKKLISKVHDGYVRMMMRVANCRVVSGGAITGYGGGGMCEFGMRPMKEYDEKIIVQMYNSLVKRQAQLLALDHEVHHPPQIKCSQ